MKAIGAGLIWLASATGAFAYFQTDIENHARWVVLDGMPLLAIGQPIGSEVINLRTNDIATQPVPISAVCGTLDFHNTDDGTAEFVLFYSVDDDGKMAMVGRPFLYDRIWERGFDTRYEAAIKFCGDSVEIAVVVGGGVAAETKAAAVTVRP